MKINQLDEAAWLATCVQPAERKTDGSPVVNFWPYFDAIPATDFESHDCSAEAVDYVCRMGDAYEHVLVNSMTPNVFMAIVIDLKEKAVLGHRLMKFKEKQDGDKPAAADDR